MRNEKNVHVGGIAYQTVKRYEGVIEKENNSSGFVEFVKIETMIHFSETIELSEKRNIVGNQDSYAYKGCTGWKNLFQRKKVFVNRCKSKLSVHYEFRITTSLAASITSLQPQKGIIERFYRMNEHTESLMDEAPGNIKTLRHAEEMMEFLGDKNEKEVKEKEKNRKYNNLVEFWKYLVDKLQMQKKKGAEKYFVYLDGKCVLMDKEAHFKVISENFSREMLLSMEEE